MRTSRMRRPSAGISALLVFSMPFIARAQDGTSARADARDASAPLTPPPTEQDRAAAGRLFAHGLALAREGRYALAKQAFLEAYRARPHYAVLYNVAQADLQLGHTQSAIEYLERYLSDGSEELGPEEKEAVVRRIAEMRAREPNTESEAPAAGAPAPSQEREPRSAAAAISAPPAASSNGSVTPRQAPAPPSQPDAAQLAPPLRLDPARSTPTPAPALDTGARPWGVVLTVTGAALLGTAVGLYTWNGGRQERWREQRAELDAVPERELALAADAELWHAAQANNDMLASIQRVDVLALLAGSIGTLALGAGAWELLARPAPTPASLSSAGYSLSWHTVW